MISRPVIQLRSAPVHPGADVGVRQFLRTAHAVRRHSRAHPAELRTWQDAHLRRLLSHAYAQVPFYRRLFDRHRLHPRHVRGVVDLDLIPIISKQDLRERPLDQILARGTDPARLIEVRTNGSTGEPFVVRRTYLEQAFSVLFRERAYEDFGLRLRERIAGVTSIRWRDAKDAKLVGRILRALGVHPKITIDGMQDPARTIEELARFRPHMVTALPEMLARVADHILPSGRHDIRPRIVVTGGEVLTPPARQRIAEAFGVAPLQTYASHEFPLIGWECRETGELHTCDDGLIVEVLHDGRSAGPGETGEIVVTNLHAYAMPLIRYRLADLVTRGSDRCRCGRPFATLTRVQGRAIDYLTLPNGRRVHPYRLLERLQSGDEVPIRQFQVLQERVDRVVLTVVPGRNASAELRDRIESQVRSVLGPEIELELRLVDEIPLDPSGKFRHVRSLVSGSWEAGQEELSHG